jgi:lysozyme family protein
MMSAVLGDFDYCFKLIVSPEIEGGYENDPRDPGGETKYGICKREYPSVNIKDLTLEGAAELYRKDYWNAAHCDALPLPLCLFVFDCAVNQGVGTSAKILQHALGVTEDGQIGPATLAAASKSGKAVAAKFMSTRALRYTTTKNADIYLSGWLNRLFIVTLSAGEV